jgi:hypothetical protein
MGMSGWRLGPKLRRIGVTWDRINVGDDSDISDVRYALRQGVKAVVLYDPGFGGRSPAQCAAQVKALARKILPLGLSEIEFGNEAYYQEQPAAYAAQYAAAHAALGGMGVTLIANSAGDYQRPDGSWSQDARGGGWIHDFIHALPARGAEIDAFSIHPYGPMNQLTDGEDSGWLELPRYHNLAVANHVNVPWYVTEVGHCLGGPGCITPLGPVNQQTQAADITKYLNDTISKYSYVAFLDIFAIKDNATGRFGLLLSPNNAPRASYRALAHWMIAHGLARTPPRISESILS